MIPMLSKMDAIKLYEINKIIDENEKVTVACEKFYKKELSAKVVRTIFETLDNSMKITMLNLLYGEKDKRENNSSRLPPKILAPNEIVIGNEQEVELYGTLLKYYLINQYESSKTKERFCKFKNTINQYLGNPFMKIISLPLSNSKKNDVEKYAIKGFVEELMYKGKKYDIEPLGLPLAMTIGIEIELVGCNVEEIYNIRGKLQQFKIDFLKGFKIKDDYSVKRKNKYGSEVVSFVLNDTENDWKKLRDVCLFLQAIGGEVNKTCGGHMHIGSNILGVDKEAWEFFLNIWAEVEPLMYMITNRRGEKTRRKIETYGQMVYSKIQSINWDSVHINNEEDIKKICDKVNNRSRYFSVNLKNVGKAEKNTIEFRLANGSVNYDIWRENCLLFGRLIQTAKICSIDYSIKKEKLQKLFEPDLSEKEKLIRFLDLIFEDEKEKQIFYKRWESRSGEKPLFGEKNVTTYHRQKKSEIKKIKEIE